MRTGAELNGRLTRNLRTLHLPAFRESFEPEAVRATQESLSYEQYLLELSDREVETRQQNRIARLLREFGSDVQREGCRVDRGGSRHLPTTHP